MAYAAAEWRRQPNINDFFCLTQRSEVLTETQNIGVVIGSGVFRDAGSASAHRSHPLNFISNDTHADTVTTDQNAPAAACGDFFSQRVGVVGVVVAGGECFWPQILNN